MQEDVSDNMEIDQTGTYGQHNQQNNEISALRQKINLGRQIKEEQKAEQIIQMADAQNYRQAQKQQETN